MGGLLIGPRRKPQRIRSGPDGRVNRPSHKRTSDPGSTRRIIDRKTQNLSVAITDRNVRAGLSLAGQNDRPHHAPVTVDSKADGARCEDRCHLIAAKRFGPLDQAGIQVNPRPEPGDRDRIRWLRQA